MVLGTDFYFLLQVIYFERVCAFSDFENWLSPERLVGFPVFFVVDFELNGVEVILRLLA
jgi:cytochrome c oxidase assembly protein Cox11